MKEYTTPRIAIQLKGQEEILKNAQKVLLIVESKKTELIKTAEVTGDIVAVTLTQEETVQLGVGQVSFEVTIKMPDGTVIKSNTMTATMERALYQVVV